MKGFSYNEFNWFYCSFKKSLINRKGEIRISKNLIRPFKLLMIALFLYFLQEITTLTIESIDSIL